MARARNHATPPDGDRAMTRTCVCTMLLFLVACTPGTDVIYGSSIRLGGGLPSITTMAVGRIGAQPAAGAPAAPASPAPSAASSPERRGVGIGQPGSGESIPEPDRRRLCPPNSRFCTECGGPLTGADGCKW
jgi:hypothetical protein